MSKYRVYRVEGEGYSQTFWPKEHVYEANTFEAAIKMDIELNRPLRKGGETIIAVNAEEEGGAALFTVTPGGIEIERRRS